jgi:hypothetical protein
MTSDVQTPLPALPIGPAGAGKWDIRFGLAAAGVFLMHVVLVVLSACPFWTMCFPLPKIGGFLWVTGALESGLDQATATGVVPVRVLSEANTRRSAAGASPSRSFAVPCFAVPELFLL